MLEVALHESGVGKIFTLDDLYAILTKGKHLLEDAMSGLLLLDRVRVTSPGSLLPPSCLA